MATTVILAGPGDFLPVIFVLIAITSGIINFVKERKAAADRDNANVRGGGGDWKANGNGNANSEFQSEIDAFLQEVSPERSGSSRPQGQGDSQQQRRRKKTPSDDDAERRRQVRARREHERRQLEEDQKRQSIRKRHLETGDLEGVSSRHEVSKRHVGHVESSVEDRHLTPQIDGSTTGDSVGEDASQPFEAGLMVAMLRNPAGIRNAILLGEIIGPPVSRRPRRNR
ncbi:MAG: hypothetical protein HQ518_25620 [Rhodopirellula sp.]|nr:hypothetical protein [Rhodopirellula sp.]